MKERENNHRPDTLEITNPVNFGKTGLKVTRLCIGAASLGNMTETFGPVSEEEAERVLRHVFVSSPINFLDTASIYGDSERRIGNTLQKIGGLPADFVLATKA